jgi:predicted DNA-binding protein YlxM (UPF0122 family)
MLYKNEPWLMEQYWYNKLSVDQIALKYGYERSAIFRSMRKLEIPRRSIREARLLACQNKPYRERSWLHKQYRKKKLSADRIAEKCSTDSGTIIGWLDKFEIQRRDSIEVAKLRRKNLLKTLHGSWLNRILLIVKDFLKSIKKYF